MEGLTYCVPSTVFRGVPNGVSTNFVRERDEVLEGQVVILNIVAGERCVKSWGHL
jgi:hypothetical protein